MFKFLIGIFVVIILVSPFFVKVKSKCVNCNFELKSGSLYFAKKENSKILKNNFLVSDFSMRFKLPNILLVNVLLKKPEFIIKNESGQSVAIDKNGQVLGVPQNTTLPTLLVSGDLKKVKEYIPTEHLFALNLVAGVWEMYQVNTGKIIDDTLVVELPGDIKVIFPLNGDKEILLGSLRVVYSKVENSEEENLYREIDLRFKNPVLR